MMPTWCPWTTIFIIPSPAYALGIFEKKYPVVLMQHLKKKKKELALLTAGNCMFGSNISYFSLKRLQHHRKLH